MSTSRVRGLHGALFCMVFAANVALAGSPLQTEDADLLARSECELDGAQLLRSKPSRDNQTGLQMTCGIDGRHQLGLAIQRTQSEGGLLDSDVLLAGKTQWWRGHQLNEVSTTQIALAWQLAATLGADQTWRHVSKSLIVAMSQPLASGGTVHLNLGLGYDSMARQSSRSWGLALDAGNAVLGSSVVPVVEVYGDDGSAAWWRVGARMSALIPRLFLNLAFSREIGGGTEATSLHVGFKLAL